MEAGFQRVRLHSSNRSAFVINAQGGHAEFTVSQPSDCLALERGVIGPSEVKDIHVSVGYTLTSNINGPPQPEPPDVWQGALQHLLNTYKPQRCSIYTNGAETGLGQQSKMEIKSNLIYSCVWRVKQQELRLTRLVQGILEHALNIF